jgi:cytidine deaminase
VSHPQPTKSGHMTLTQTLWNKLADAAWEARKTAHIYGSTAVGAAVMTADSLIYTGCNVEHRYRSHDVHAEVNAITTMVANGKTQLIAVLVVAERKRFTPCGACLDWIFQFGGSDCEIAYQTKGGGQIEVHQAHELMPFYPE